MTQRTASCVCGDLKVDLVGEPVAVFTCHCQQCQRRSGSAFGLSAYFGKEQASINGTTTSFRRPTDSGRTIEFHFCPKCGSTVLWYADAFPEHVGIAAGSFADPEFIPPTFAGWTAHKHTCVEFPPGFPQALMGEDPRL
jgi:hypothetical protein